ncbi:MAG: methyltransferase domain-containing protein [Pontixanthobacter sp.]
MLEDRLIAEEMMDADDLSEATYIDVVRDLAKVNRITRAHAPTLRFIERIAAKRPIKVLDVGFGDGDMLRAIHNHLGKRQLEAELVGIDLNPRSLAAAQASSSQGIDYRIGDYADLAGEGWDCIISSLVAHHMTHAQLVAFIGFMEREAAAGWFINDLHRHGFAYMGYPLLAKLMRWHSIVRHDGRMSIARSYRPAEWGPILAEAGVDDARIYRAFPFRLCVERVR